MTDQNTTINAATISAWLVEKFAHKIGCSEDQLDVDKLFVDFGLDSTEVLLLTGELEDWIDLELPPTAMWYHPTIAKLSLFIEEEYEEMMEES